MTSTAVTAALKVIDEASNPEMALVAAKVKGLLIGYNARWKTQPYQVVSIEETITSDLFNPQTGKTSRTYCLAGKRDNLLRNELNELVLMDHKTTSAAIENPSEPYWSQLQIEAQPTVYMLLEHLNGRRVDYAIWDVVRKPGIAPRQIPKDQQEAIKRHGDYFGFKCESVNAETLEMYTARLAHDCSIVRPQWYFQRRQVTRIDKEIIEKAEETWDLGKAMSEERLRGKHRRNSDACMNWNRPCQFLGICSGYDTPDSDKWRKKDWVHVELDPMETEDRGKEYLTVSRMKAFESCKRKHFYSYELGIERAHNEEEAESLRFGSLWHIALEAWFTEKKREQENGSADCDVSSSGDESNSKAESALIG